MDKLKDFKAKSWFDENGLVHNIEYPTADSTENEVSFTGEYVMWGLLLGLIEPDSYEHKRIVFNMKKFFVEEWETKDDVAHDERTGLLAVGGTDDYSIFKCGNRWWLHPRDWIFWGYMKYGFWFWPLLWVVSIANIVSCARTYKGDSLTTSGKRLAFQRNFGAKMNLTHAICTWLIKRNDKFGSWYRVSWLYYTTNGNYLLRTAHPNCRMTKLWEKESTNVRFIYFK